MKPTGWLSRRTSVARKSSPSDSASVGKNATGRVTGRTGAFSNDVEVEGVRALGLQPDVGEAAQHAAGRGEILADLARGVPVLAVEAAEVVVVRPPLRLDLEHHVGIRLDGPIAEAPQRLGAVALATDRSFTRAKSLWPESRSARRTRYMASATAGQIATGSSSRAKATA